MAVFLKYRLLDLAEIYSVVVPDSVRYKSLPPENKNRIHSGAYHT